jgi:hypothetical protein
MLGTRRKIVFSKMAGILQQQDDAPRQGIRICLYRRLKRFAATHMTFMAEDIAAFAAYLPAVGAVVLEAPKPVPTGQNMLRYPEQTLVEYVEHHDKHPADILPSGV